MTKLICNDDKTLFETYSLQDAKVLSRKNLLITGGTGFVGSWLLECLNHLNRTFDLQIQIYVLSRDPARWIAEKPHLATAENVHAVKGDVLLPENWAHLLPQEIDSVIHAAFDSSKHHISLSDFNILETMVAGTKNLLDVAKRCSVKRFLYISSGAVYGRHTSSENGISETDFLGLDPTDSANAYALGKKAAEAMVTAFGREGGGKTNIARLFAFSGRYLPLDGKLAFGNFISDTVASRPIAITGNSQNIRSYMYGADMAIWLLRILVSGQPGDTYNVGSPDKVTILQLARKIKSVLNGSSSIDVLNKNYDKPDSVYYPNVEKAGNDLSLKIKIDLDDAIRRTIHSLRKDDN